jgi:ATP-binding cassette subfamily C protein CydD
VRPLDPRLLRYASAVRPFLAVGALLGVVQTALTIAFAFLVSQAVVAVVDQHPSRLGGLLGFLAATIVARSLVGWALESLSARTAVRVKSQLRQRVVDAIVARGHAWLAGRSSARLATLVGPGLDALDDYFGKYLPQLILTALATPLLVIVLFTQDLLSGVVVVCCLPVIPVFMILIGWTTRSAQARQWDRLARLASSFLDAVNGLSTLKAFGRERRQVRRIGTITDEYRSETMKVLQVSFLSGFALEMAASLSVAIVAVFIGVRLVAGDLGLPVGLFLLLLTPEVFLPLRQVGAQYHAASDGVAAADDVFAVLDGEGRAAAARDGAPVDRVGVGRVGLGRDDSLILEDVAVAYDGVTAVGPISFRAPVGEVTALTGPSGAGKTSLVGAVLGTVAFSGRIGWQDAGRPVAAAEIAWAGQRPGLLAGSVAANVALGDDLDPDAVVAALESAGARDIDPGRELGPGGAGLSGGQAQRVALARAVYRLRRRSCRLLLVDEPTSALDVDTERVLTDGLAALAREGVAVVVVTHRPGVRDRADRVVDIGSGSGSGSPATRGAVVS